jgi:hypothetical protein
MDMDKAWLRNINVQFIHLKLSSAKLSHSTVATSDGRFCALLYLLEPKRGGGGTSVGFFYCLNPLWNRIFVAAHTFFAFVSLGPPLSPFSMHRQAIFILYYMYLLHREEKLRLMKEFAAIAGGGGGGESDPNKTT